MTPETAYALSRDLLVAGISHTIQVGYHENLVPQEQCRIDLPIPRRYDGGLSAAMLRLEEIGARHGLTLATGMMGDGLTFSSPTPGALLR